MEVKTDDKQKIDAKMTLMHPNFLTQKRKLMVNWANKDLIKICETRLSNYLFTENWKFFNTGFISLNNKIDLEEFVKFPICPTNAKNKNFLDLKNDRLIICANHLKNNSWQDTSNQSHFDDILTYNLTQMYDEVKSKYLHGEYIKDCNQIACSQIRALHISKICMNEKECYVNHIEKEVFTQYDQCMGKSAECVENVFKRCYLDISPHNMFGYKN